MHPESDTGKSTALVPRETVESIVARRAQALDLYAEAHHALEAASEALDAARTAEAALSGSANSFTFLSEKERKAFVDRLCVPPRPDFLATARRLTDIGIWGRLVELTELQRLMDKQAKDELRTQLQNEAPEATAETIYATLERFALDAGTIFRRGIANAFSSLDRRFRSHDGWKIGSRVIITRMFDDGGWWNHYSNTRDTLIDIERAFYVLEGLEQPANYGGIVGKIDAARTGGWGARQTEVESEYFTVRIFKNGNAHLWFRRDDLLRKVNKLLAEYYGEVIPHERDPDPDTGFDKVKTTPAKRFGFYPTSEGMAEDIVRNCQLYRREDQPGMTVLEPSAGTGNLARPCVKNWRAAVDCVELQDHLAAGLLAEGIYRRVWQADFLAMRPDPDKLYDRIIMNPPFDRERDIDHVLHALRFLKPDGFLAAIMSAGTEFRETKKAVHFRALMAEKRARFSDLPAGSFAHAGTYVNTCLLRVYADGRTVPY
ncbi:DUF4942 domain-containing protein [Marinibaculum pumilum]|uniref:DUF4942 domain-containing protein n=1 Tax=Marinibaculum pumilum TaxID=1766165 RepID=A0ABV7L754_9PROT